MKYVLGTRSSEVVFRSKMEMTEFPEKSVLIIDRKISELYQKELLDLLDKYPFLILNADEKAKNFSNAQKIYRFFLKNEVNRSSTIIGIGGGIITDLTAFTASTFMRGCNLYLFPTTFLAMIDASVGGKTSVNFNSIKNNIGTFYPADKIIIIPDFLKTLSENEKLNGWAECIKIALVEKSPLFEMLLKNTTEIPEEILKQAIEIKMTICENDLEDKGRRKHLNLGHTFAHIIETISGFKISHGFAVAVGIRTAARLSLEKRFIDLPVYDSINDLLDLYKLPDSIEMEMSGIEHYNFEKILKSDKKSTSSTNLILFKGLNRTFIYKVENIRIIWNVLQKYIKKQPGN